MPHFIIDCSKSILESQKQEYILEQVFLVANSTGLFKENDIKVRLNTFSTYSVGNKKDDFMHVFAHIIEGRSIEQKSDLSKQIVSKLTELFPKVPNIAMNISDFEKATYYNRSML